MGLLHTEMKNNSFKVSKWLASAFLAGVDLLKIGFVTRSLRNDNENHSLLAVHSVAPQELNSGLIDYTKIWTIVKQILEWVAELPDVNKFILLKDPNQNKLNFR